MVEDMSCHKTVKLDEMPLEWIKKVDHAIEITYPETFGRLEHVYGDDKAFALPRVRQFLACNFSVKDGIPDIDEDYNFNLEHVPCPARIKDLCTARFCNPVIDTTFSKRELEILKPFADALSDSEIAEQLFISKHTVHNHINNMYKKAGLVNKGNPDRKLIAYAHAKKLV
jgi:DNA-binding CsgD family transcriptional regulator